MKPRKEHLALYDEDLNSNRSSPRMVGEAVWRTAEIHITGTAGSA